MAFDRGHVTLYGSGTLNVQCRDDVLGVWGVAPDATIFAEHGRSVWGAFAKVYVMRPLKELGGDVDSLYVDSLPVELAPGCVVRELDKVDNAELFGLRPYSLHLSDIQKLDKARLVTFDLDSWKSHLTAVLGEPTTTVSRRYRFRKLLARDGTVLRDRLEGFDATGQRWPIRDMRSSMTFWYRIGLAMEQHGASGRDRATVRRTEHELRRRSIGKPWWSSPEKRWLGLYRLTGYGDRVVVPLLLQAAISLALTVAVLWGRAGGVHRWWAVSGKLFVQPLRFFIREDPSEVALHGGTYPLPHGTLPSLAPYIAQASGTVLIAMALNAVGRLVRGR